MALPGIGFGVKGLSLNLQPQSKWEFPKCRGALIWGPYDKDPTI